MLDSYWAEVEEVKDGTFV